MSSDFTQHNEPTPSDVPAVLNQVTQTGDGLPQFMGFDWGDYGDGYYSNKIAQTQILEYLGRMSSNTIKLDNILKYDLENNVFKTGTILHTTPQSEHIAAASFFNSKNIKIVYETYIWPSNATDNFAQSLPNFPESKIDAFFKVYTEKLVEEARLAEKIGAKVYVFGAEMGKITSLYPDQWANVISNIRANFSGLITYGANFNLASRDDIGKHGEFNGANEAATLSFGHLLDFIGLDCYSAPPLSMADSRRIPTIAEAYNAWDNPSERGYSVIEIMRGLAEKYNKPLFIVENAWLSQQLASNHVGGDPKLPPSQETQANLFHGEFLQFFSHLKDVLGGITVGGQNPEIKYQDRIFLRDGYLNPDGSFGLSREQGGQIAGKLAEKTVSDFFSGAIQNNGLTVTMTPTKKAGFGYNANDIFYDAVGNHRMEAAGGNDLVYASAGNDSVDGGAGTDFMSYTGKKTNYEIVFTSSGVNISGAEGNDTLTNVERLRFTDGVTAVDINGNAGQAYRLYQAALDRTPDERGLAGWIKFMDEGGALVNMAQQFIDSQEFKTKYGALDNSKFVNQLYLNVLDRNGEAAGIAGWVNGLANGLTRADVLKGFSESAENQANVIGQIKNGIPYLEWWLA